jgi:hypothetical protein
MKPGYKTTEFWITMLIQLLGIGTLTGVVTPDQSTVIADAAGQGAEIATTGYTQVMALIAMVGSAFGYDISRGNAKKGEK